MLFDIGLPKFLTGDNWHNQLADETSLYRAENPRRVMCGRIHRCGEDQIAHAAGLTAGEDEFE